MYYYLNTAFVDYPIYLSGTVGQDVHFISPTTDNVGLTNYIAVAGNSITISDWWATVSNCCHNFRMGIEWRNGRFSSGWAVLCQREHPLYLRARILKPVFSIATASTLARQVQQSDKVFSSITRPPSLLGINFDGNAESGYTLPWLSFVSANYSTVQREQASLLTWSGD